MLIQMEKTGKNFVRENNATHIKNLVKMTLNDRRPWDENEVCKIIGIVTKFP